MSDITANQWIFSIFTGVIASAIVAFAPSLLISKKNKKQVSIANSEVIQILKPYLAGIGLPEIIVWILLLFQWLENIWLKKNICIR